MAVASRAMPRSDRARWALLALPMLVGAVLLSHGLDSWISEPASSAAGVALSDAHEHPEGAEGHAAEHCDGCLVGHLMVGCMAILASAATFVAVGRRPVRSALVRRTELAVRWGRPWGDLLRPPEPAWVRLAVMRC